MKNIINSQNAPELVDFKENQIGAKIWGEKKFEKWQKEDLNFIELNTLRDFSQIPDYINSYWEATKGETITDVNLIENYQTLLGNRLPEELIKQTEILDRAIEKATITEPMIVYLRTDEVFFKKTAATFKNFENGQVDLKKFRELRAEYENQKKPIYEFLMPSLVKVPEGAREFQNQQFPFVIKISLPRGTNAGYLGKISFFDQWNQMIIGRKQDGKNYSLQFDDFAIEKDYFDNELIVANASLQIDE